MTWHTPWSAPPFACRTRSAQRFRIAAVLSMVVAAGCVSVPLRADPEGRTLVIENPVRRPIRLERVGRGAIDLGTESMIEVQLEVDRYVVHDGRVGRPAPLVADRDRIDVRIIEPPRPVDGYVAIPGGPTLIGDVLGVGAPDERPARIVDVAPFLIARHEVTNEEYTAFLNARGRVSAEWIDFGGPKCRIHRDGDRFMTDAPRHPVVTVTVAGAEMYCSWLTEVTGVVHRLPTEVEWERAARGPTSATYSYGDVYDPEAANQESGVLLETERFAPTGWGIHDMTGNAFEWTSSEYAPGLRVLRGGSYVLDGPYLRNSFRMWYRPGVQADDIGFRVVREAEGIDSRR